jgi:hypothetical protein
MIVKPLDILLARMNDAAPKVLHPAAAAEWNNTRVSSAAICRDYLHATLRRTNINALTADTTAPRLRVLDSAVQLEEINTTDAALCLYLALCHRKVTP